VREARKSSKPMRKGGLTEKDSARQKISGRGGGRGRKTGKKTLNFDFEERGIRAGEGLYDGVQRLLCEGRNKNANIYHSKGKRSEKRYNPMRIRRFRR